MLTKVKKIIQLHRLPKALNEKSLKEIEILGLLCYVRGEINRIHIDIDHMSDETLSVQILRLDAMEKSYYVLFNKLRNLRGIDSFELIVKRLKETPRYETLNERYQLDQVGKNYKFLSGFNYNTLPVFTFDESE